MVKSFLRTKTFMNVFQSIQYAFVCSVSFLVITGCASQGGLVKEIKGPGQSPIVSAESVTIKPFREGRRPPADYIVGPNDVLYVNVFGRPEMSSFVPTGGSSKLYGSRVDGSGNIQLPIVGSVHVSGLTVEQIQNKLRKVFTTYIKKPWIVVEITDYKSEPLYLLGQFRTPGTYYMDRPMNIIQGISLGGGLDTTANYRGARILRDNKLLPVDIYRLLREGDTTQNIWLKPGDAIYVPDSRKQNVFVMGAVRRPGPVPMVDGELSLLSALSGAGFDETLSYSKDIRIIRSLSPTRGQLIVINLKKIKNGDSMDFPLMEGDVVFLAKSAIGNWNVAISEILPSLQAISAILNPFVQIKYLERGTR